MVPAADGQLGTIVRLYRYWKLTGDDGFLRSAWQNAARSLDFAGTHWDRDGDNVLDAEQHTTYDIEFHGMNSYTSLIYYAALKAAAEMADYLGDTARGVRYERAWQDGARRMDALLWNGRWYEQALDDVNRYRYQFGRGCLTDQLLGQSLACTAGIGHLVPPEHARVALQSIVRQNFRQDFRLHANTQRSYAMPGEAGTVLCTWPDGGRPRLPFVYCDEVWSGVEYQLATHLFHEGLVEEGLSVVRAVRNRYDGVKRNPWNEVECGHHYVRSLASWGLLVALCGFHCDLPRRRITFDPRIHADDFSAFFSTGTAWGVYRQRRDPATGRRAWGIDVLFGTLQDVEVNGTPEQ